jgi:hypothetical protein
LRPQDVWRYAGKRLQDPSYHFAGGRYSLFRLAMRTA